MIPIRHRLSKTYFTQKKLFSRNVLPAGLLGFGMAGSLLWQAGAPWLLFATGVGLILLIYARLSCQIGRERDHIEAAFALTAALRPVAPLPPFSGAAISAEIARVLVTMVLERQPRLIVECGSGVSTLVLAYALKRLGSGTLIALEHDEQFAGRTSNLLRLHKLEPWGRVIHTPLTGFEIRGECWQWYDVGRANLQGPIDLAFVDGPPGWVQAMARYPAGPLLHAWLAPRAVVLLADANRPDERRALRRWQREPPLVFNRVAMPHGLVQLELSRPDPAADDGRGIDVIISRQQAGS
jgi:predicted O-methyltransferase YrrM